MAQDKFDLDLIRLIQEKEVIEGTHSHFFEVTRKFCRKSSLESELGKRFTKMAVARWHAGAKRRCGCLTFGRRRIVAARSSPASDSVQKL